MFALLTVEARLWLAGELANVRGFSALGYLRLTFNSSYLLVPRDLSRRVFYSGMNSAKPIVGWLFFQTQKSESQESSQARGGADFVGERWP